MKYVRALLLVMAAMLVVTSSAWAQGGGGGRGRGGRGMAMLMQGITLGDRQAKVDSIVQAFAAMRNEQAPMVQGQPPDSATMAKRNEITQKQYDEIRKLLTEDEQKIFDENRKNLPTGRGRGGP